jgi:hypothetical protein
MHHSSTYAFIATAEFQAGSKSNGNGSLKPFMARVPYARVSTADLLLVLLCVASRSCYQSCCSVDSLAPAATPVDIVAECTRVALTCAWTDSIDGLGIDPTTCSRNACVAIYRCTRHARAAVLRLTFYSNQDRSDVWPGYSYRRPNGPSQARLTQRDNW